MIISSNYLDKYFSTMSDYVIDFTLFNDLIDCTINDLIDDAYIIRALHTIYRFLLSNHAPMTNRKMQKSVAID